MIVDRRTLLRAGALAVVPSWGWAKDLLTTPARVSPKATSSLMLSVCATARRIVAVGERGLILVSTDAGKTWVQGASPTSVTLTATYFVDDDRGWAVGHSGVVLGTVDGGKTWTLRFDGHQANALLVAHATRRLAEIDGKPQSPERAKQLAQAKDALADVNAGARFGPARPLLDVWFSSPSEGFVVGSYGQLFQTSDGGAAWHYIGDRLDNPDAYHLNAIAPIGAGKLMVAGEAGRVWLSGEAGRSWTRADTGYNGQLYGGFAARDGSGIDSLIAFGFAGRIFRSVDGGASWNEVATGRRKTLVAGRARGNTIVLVDVEGAVLESADAGRSWREASGPLPFQIRGATVTPTRKLVVAGFGGLHLL